MSPWAALDFLDIHCIFWLNMSEVGKRVGRFVKEGIRSGMCYCCWIHSFHLIPSFNTQFSSLIHNNLFKKTCCYSCRNAVSMPSHDGGPILFNFSELMQPSQWGGCCILRVVGHSWKPHEGKGMFVPLWEGYNVAASVQKSCIALVPQS